MTVAEKQKTAAEKLTKTIEQNKAKNSDTKSIESKIDESLRIETIMVPFNEIEKLDQNPRGNLESEALAELADSLLSGQIQDVGAIREDGKIRLFLGYRRLAAFAKNVEDGRIEETHPVRVTIWNVSKNEAYMMAFTENVLRQEMSPLDECDGVSQMLNLGYSERQIAQKTGLKLKKVSEYATVANSNEHVRDLVATKKRSISWASSLMKMGEENIRSVLSEIRSNPDNFSSVAQLEKMVRSGKILVSNAIFDVKESGLTITSDLFSPEIAYFTDSAKFWAKQMDAVELLKARLEEEGHRSVDIIRYETFNEWRYEKTDTAKNNLAFIHIAADGTVTAHRHYTDPSSVEETTELNHIFGSTPDENNESETEAERANISDYRDRGICINPPTSKTANLLMRIRADAATKVMNDDTALTKRVLLLSLIGDRAIGTKGRNKLVDSTYNAAGTNDTLTVFTELERFEYSLEPYAGDLLSYLLTLDDDVVERMTKNYTITLAHRMDGKKPIFGQYSPARMIMNAKNIPLRSMFTPNREFFEELSLANLREIAHDILPETEASMADVTAKNDLITILTKTFESAAEDPFNDESAKVNEWQPEYL